jgi:mRNA-degrading endonuclease RelE of RelBE toxin-antitoxin system
MSYNVLPTFLFEKELKRLVKKFPSLKNEYKELINEIELNPETGILISNNCYKIRLAISSKGKGKRGGARVITYVYIATQSVYLLTIYDKSEKEDLKPNELNEIINSLEL